MPTDPVRRRFRLPGVLVSALVAAFVLAPGGLAGPRGAMLEMYTATVDRATLAELLREDYDVSAVRGQRGGFKVDLVLSRVERTKLAAQGIRLALWRNALGSTASELRRLQQEGGFEVFRAFDGAGGIREEIYAVAREHRNIVRLFTLGRTLQGREILALRVSGGGADSSSPGRRPAVVYLSTQHAREWISTEVNRRLLHYFVDGYGRDAAVTSLVNARELWFVLVANPDGYQYTFDAERLWRKNLRDVDGNGRITSADGVDPNRNFPEHWGYDDEGSSSQSSAEDYRGTRAASEPETRAAMRLLDLADPAMLVNYHSYGYLLLYPYGWQVQTPSEDDPVYVALSGTDARPAIPGFDPGVGGELYITNGETTDFAYRKHGTLSWTVELGEGRPANGFLYPDDEAQIQAEFERNLPFALDVARSAARPAQPISHLGTTTKPFYLDVGEFDPEKENNPLTDFRFSVSYGDPQPVQVLARKSLGTVTLRYRINGGRVHSARTGPWAGGERYGGYGVHYRIMRGRVTGTRPGDEVEVWFTAGRAKSESFTYSAEAESKARVLILSAEDYSGRSPGDGPYATEPLYLSYYRDALAANGVRADVYDVDAHGRQAPDVLGVLDHYDAVVWYTGEDVITRETNQVPGTASRLASDELLAVREYLNQGGRLLYSGKFAGLQYAQGYEYNQETNSPCDPADPDDGCVLLSDDFLQYYLGAFLYTEDTATIFDAAGNPVDLREALGDGTPFTGLRWSFNEPGSAENQDHSATLLATSSFLPTSRYPQFRSWSPVEWAIPGPKPYEPKTGSSYVYSQRADISYKRLLRTIDLRGKTTGRLSFSVSRDTEPGWDFVFVEAHTFGRADWTTLPDLNGHTSTDTGISCPEGWHELHPFLAHYQTVDDQRGECRPRGTSGAWNAASGRSGGWENWAVDLSAYAGRRVVVSITYVSDWGFQGIGVFLDDVRVSTGEATSFESDLGGWIVPAAPLGSAANANAWIRTASLGFDEGAVVATPDTLYFGFGVEGIDDAAVRARVLGRAVKFLLP